MSQTLDPNDIEALKRRIAELEAAQQANLGGSGAIAQGGGERERDLALNQGLGLGNRLAIIGYDVPDDEINDALTPTADFYIARYPVTVAQFRAFAEAIGFEPGDADALRDPDNRPVRYLDWHDALAYCDWLHQSLATAPALDGCAAARLVREGSWRVTLPSELEWEKAARGGLAGALFSWGDTPDPNRANYRDSEIGDTSAVGCFPANDVGLYDMIGNVWEWTRSLWGTNLMAPDFLYPYDLNDPKREAQEAGDEVYRVVRGGSWLDGRGGARCAFRGRVRPDLRGDDLGFRVLLRSAHVLPPLLLVSPQGGTTRPDTRAGSVPAMRADPRERVCPPR